MRQTVHDVVVVRLDLHKTFAHRSGIVSVFRGTRQTDRRGYGMLLDLQVVEFQFVIESTPRIPDEVVLNDLRFGNAFTATGAAR